MLFRVRTIFIRTYIVIHSVGVLRFRPFGTDRLGRISLTPSKNIYISTVACDLHFKSPNWWLVEIFEPAKRAMFVCAWRRRENRNSRWCRECFLFQPSPIQGQHPESKDTHWPNIYKYIHHGRLEPLQKEKNAEPLRLPIEFHFCETQNIRNVSILKNLPSVSFFLEKPFPMPGPISYITINRSRTFSPHANRTPRNLWRP